MQKPCLNCKKPFDARKSITKFCSRKCYTAYERQFPILLDKNWCIKQYKQKSLLQIAKDIDCGETTVFKYFKKHGIKLDRSKALKRYKKTKEHSQNISKAKLGKQLREKNPNWKNGITSLSKSIRSLAKYKRWKQEVLSKSNCCVKCGSTKRLEADHIKKFQYILLDNNIVKLEQAIDCDELWNVDNGQVLCRHCNIGREK